MSAVGVGGVGVGVCGVLDVGDGDEIGDVEASFVMPRHSPAITCQQAWHM
jgi:hypothetical protein